MVFLDFLLAKCCAEWTVAFGAVEKPYFELESFAAFVWSSSHLPSFPRLGDFRSTFWAFCHRYHPFHHTYVCE